MLKNTRGFTLIEIMVALLIVSIGLLGVATLQMRGQQFTFIAYYRSQATFLANDIMDRMQVNFVQATDGAYAFECPASSDLSNVCDKILCEPAVLKNYDIDNWCNILQKTLPGAKAIITHQLSPINEYTIRICWANILDASKTGCDEDGMEEQVWHHIAPQMTTTP
ncbi:MAG: type IV pilus modification protein PilV [Candidatus Marithrix sp.]|nr:type IV pilus modification protein PilV [Candidatus Marithrix sp.]